MPDESHLFHFSRARREVLESWKAVALRQHGDHCLGCMDAWCCYQLPLAHLAEGVVAARAIMHRPDLQHLVPEVHDQGQRQQDLATEAFKQVAELLRAGKLGEAAAASDDYAARWYDQGERCAFHEEGRGCLIYPYRPATCFTYYVAKRCERKYLSGDVVPTLNNTEAVNAVCDLADLAYSGLTGQDVKCMPVPFVYAVSVGLRQLSGDGVEVVAIGGDA